jgi:predicted RNase H-like HicB family nuclease
VIQLDDYTVIIRPDDNGTFVAYVPAIPGCHAWGLTSDQARGDLPHVFQMIREEYDQAGKPMPDDVQVIVGSAR